MVTFNNVHRGSLSGQDSGGRAIVRHKVDVCVSLLARRRERDGRHNHLGVGVRELLRGCEGVRLGLAEQWGPKKEAGKSARMYVCPRVMR